MTNMNVILEAKDIVKTYGYEDNKIYATNHIDLQIEEGSFVAIVGRSGSGKSTLLKALSRMIKPKSGEIYIENQKLTDIKNKIKEAGYNYKLDNESTNTTNTLIVYDKDSKDSVHFLFKDNLLNTVFYYVDDNKDTFLSYTVFAH